MIGLILAIVFIQVILLIDKSDLESRDGLTILACIVSFILITLSGYYGT